MDKLRINTGVKRIQINDGPDVLEFNPTDVTFAERFYGLITDFEAKQVEYQERAEALDANIENAAEGLALLREVCEFLRERIDHLFGAGTSQKVFGDALSLNAIEQFFTGITPFFQQARTEKVEKYTGKRGGRVLK